MASAPVVIISRLSVPTHETMTKERAKGVTTNGNESFPLVADKLLGGFHEPLFPV